MPKAPSLLLIAGLVLAGALAAHAAGVRQRATRPASAPTEIATFAGGCFWSEETAFEGLPGALSVTSGYTGGQKRNPSYEEVSEGGTGHAESVEIIFDPKKTTYAALLDNFWHNVDPTQTTGQFCDHGSQYRTAIFYHGENQKKLALETERKLEQLPALKGKIVTQIVPAGTFYAAEEYHQDYYRKNPDDYHAYRVGCGRDDRLREIWGKPGREARN